MKYRIDTEFIAGPYSIDLISIGLVAEDGRGSIRRLEARREGDKDCQQHGSAANTSSVCSRAAVCALT